MKWNGLETKTLSLCLSLCLFIGCGGAFQDVRESREIAFFKADSGEKLVLVSTQGLLENKDKYREAEESDLSAAEMEKAERRFLLGGVCHASGAVIPPLKHGELARLWAGRLEELAFKVAEATPELAPRDDVYQAETLLPVRFPILDTIANLDEDERQNLREIVSRRIRRALDPQGVYLEGWLYIAGADPVRYTVVVEKAGSAFRAVSPEFPGLETLGEKPALACARLERDIEAKVAPPSVD